MTKLLEIYAITDLLTGMVAQMQPWLPCKLGCDLCCQSRFMVSDAEGQHIRGVMKQMDRKQAQQVRLRARAALKDDEHASVCPLLQDGACLAYSDRPVLCRLFGRGELPIGTSRYGCQLVEQTIAEHGGTANMVDVRDFYQKMDLIPRRTLASWLVE